MNTYLHAVSPFQKHTIANLLTQYGLQKKLKMCMFLCLFTGTVETEDVTTFLLKVVIPLAVVIVILTVAVILVLIMVIHLRLRHMLRSKHTIQRVVLQGTVSI